MFIARLNFSAFIFASILGSVSSIAWAAESSTKASAESVKTKVAAPNTVATEIGAAVQGNWRSADDRSRDIYRHPAETLEFWGLKPGMTVLEIQPGGGWWTEILAAYAHANGGRFYVTAADLGNPDLPKESLASRNKFVARFAAKPNIYGTVNFVNFGPKAAPLPTNTFDFILTARSVHGWVNGGTAEKMFADLFQALKPGGILALEQHRANEGTAPNDPKRGTASGYIMQSAVVTMASKAGFVLDGSSEINANQADTKDHPFGVWTLPPSSRTRPYSEGPDAKDPKFDRARYDSIGESDRMTLKFRKPVMMH